MNRIVDAQRLNYPWEAPPEPGQAIEVAPGVLWMRLPLPMALDHVNVYALDDGPDGWTIIDTGFDMPKSREIWGDLLAGPLGGRPVHRVVVTHHHPDHIGLAGWFADRGAELLTTRTAFLMTRMLTLDVQTEMHDETEGFYRRAGMTEAALEKRRSERPFNFADVVAPLPLGFTRIKQGDVIRMGGRDWDVHIGNGHAPEHATFWSRDDHLVLAGDQILPSISPNIGVYPTEPMADPVEDWLEACERLAGLARPDHLVLGGHKTPFVGLGTRMQQLIDNHHGVLRRLMGYLDAPKTAVDCFPAIFKREIGETEYSLALVEAVAHVSHLYQAGQAAREMDDKGAWRYRAIA